MSIEQLINWGNQYPRKLFLIDGFGAVLSAIFLGVVLVKLEQVFGIPQSTLYFLSIFPCAFAIYDGYNYLKQSQKYGANLIGIACMNLFYSCLSFGIAIYHHEEFTLYGWIYIILEIMIVLALAMFELKVAKRLHLNQFNNK